MSPLAIVSLLWILSVAASGPVPDTFTTDVVFDGTPRSVALFAHSVRAPGYVLRRRLEGGLYEDVELAPPATYRGFVQGWPDARVGASFGPDGLRMMVIGAPDAEAWIVEPQQGARAGASPLIARRADLAQTPFTCTAEAGIAAQDGAPSGVALASSSSAVRIAQIALDTDWEHVLEVGGEILVQAEADELVLLAGLVYEYYFGVSYEITALVVPVSQAADPYAGLPLGCNCGPANGAGCNGTAWEALFEGWYLGTHPGIERDAVHLMAGNGIAHSASIAGCAEFRMCNGGISCSVRPANFGRLTVLLHELGHNWGACHCNQTSCAQYDPPTCGIMHSTAGSGGILFGPTTQAALAGIGLSACLHDGTSSHVAPLVTAVVPPQVPVLGGPVVLTGDRFDEALFVDWDGTLLDRNRFHIVDPHTITLTAPTGTALGTRTVAVLGPGGSSSVAFESVECATPLLTANLKWIPLNPYFPTTVTWRYCGPVGFETRLLASRSASTVSINGFEVLAYPATFQAEVVASPGTGSFTVGFIGLPPDADFRVQLAVYDASGQLVGVSEILCHLLGAGCRPNPCGLSEDC